MAKKSKEPKLPEVPELEVAEDKDLVGMLDKEAAIVPQQDVKPVKAEVVREPERPDVRDFYKKFKDIGEDIVENYRKDRVEIDEVVKHLMKIVVHNQDGKLSRTAVENLVKALEVKSNTNANVIRILDAISKVISAGKGLGVFDGAKDDEDFSFGEMEELLEDKNDTEDGDDTQDNA
jgi:hypothetical protein